MRYRDNFARMRGYALRGYALRGYALSGYALRVYALRGYAVHGARLRGARLRGGATRYVLGLRGLRGTRYAARGYEVRSELAAWYVPHCVPRSQLLTQLPLM